MINLCFYDKGNQFSLYQLQQKRLWISLFQLNVLLLTNKPVL